MVKSMVLRELHTLEETTMDKVRFLMSDTGAQITAACREALEQKDEQESAAIGEEWTPCMKLPIVVHCRKQREGETHVSTREGITPVRHDDLIMRGVAGEEYPIGRELFDKTYTLLGEPT